MLMKTILNLEIKKEFFLLCAVTCICLCTVIGQILALVAVRKAMDYVFSQHDLSFLDDVIPEKDKKKKEDEKKKKKKARESIDSDVDEVIFTFKLVRSH